MVAINKDGSGWMKNASRSLFRLIRHAHEHLIPRKSFSISFSAHFGFLFV
jgi:hypothetical protein